MGWVRRRYRGNKVWIETSDAGEPVLDARGLARLRYKPEDDRTYSVRPGELQALAPEAAPEPSGASPTADPAAPSPAPKARRRRTATPATGEAGAGSAVARASPPVEARDPSEADLPALAGQEIQAWTDGAASGNPGPAGSGFVLLFSEHRKEAAIWLGETTNNVAELTAVREALRGIRRRDLPVRVCTDSTYVIGVLSGAMKAKANVALVAEIRAEMRAFPDLHFVKVPAHCGVEWNERADALAREAIRAKRSRVTSIGGAPAAGD